jgi:hypothetical protein
MLKARLPKTEVDLLSKWYEDNYDNKIERSEALSKWYNDQFDNGTEKTDAFSKLDTKQNLQDYFLIQERLIPLYCRDCETEVTTPLRILFSSNSFVREGRHLYYYLVSGTKIRMTMNPKGVKFLVRQTHIIKC